MPEIVFCVILSDLKQIYHGLKHISLAVVTFRKNVEIGYNK